MASGTDITPSEEHPIAQVMEAPDLSPLASAHTEKGSLRSMWELLMQLRVLLPYLTRLVPMLDRGLLKAAPDLTDIRKSLEETNTGIRGLNSQIRDHSLQLEKIEEQLIRLRELEEQSRKEVSEIAAEMRSTGRRLAALITLAGLVFAVVIAVLVLQVMR